MNKTTTLTAATVLVGAAAISFARYRSLINDLTGRFPDLDRKVIRKAYSEFLKNAKDNAYGPMADFTDEKMDRIFLDIVQKQTASK